MLFNTTHKNKDYIAESNNLLGKSFSFFERIKKGGIGSSRMVVDEFSEILQPKNKSSIDINYMNIEVRPKGIIVHYTNKLDRYSWLIPYFRLVIYNAQNFSIHANGNYIKCKKNKNYLNNKKFIDKMITTKNNFLNLGYYDM